MINPGKEAEILERLVQWAEPQPMVRAVLLTSTRAIPNSTSDIFSDYDVLLVLSDVRRYYEDQSWFGDFGPVLAVYRNPLEIIDGQPQSGFVIQYENGLKIDFGLLPAEGFAQVVIQPDLSRELDAGYRVLLDKDQLTDGLPPPTYQSYIPKPPTEAQYQEVLESFFLNTTYVAKYLWRDDLVAAKHLLDYYMKQEDLLPMLVWHLELEHQWSVKPGPYGRRLKKWLRPDLWADLENTYSGAGLEENWETLDRMIALMRKAAQEVGDRLGFKYPIDLEGRTVAYLYAVKNVERL